MPFMGKQCPFGKWHQNSAPKGTILQTTKRCHEDTILVPLICFRVPFLLLKVSSILNVPLRQHKDFVSITTKVFEASRGLSFRLTETLTFTWKMKIFLFGELPQKWLFNSSGNYWSLTVYYNILSSLWHRFSASRNYFYRMTEQMTTVN